MFEDVQNNHNSYNRSQPLPVSDARYLLASGAKTSVNNSKRCSYSRCSCWAFSRHHLKPTPSLCPCIYTNSHQFFGFFFLALNLSNWSFLHTYFCQSTVRWNNQWRSDHLYPGRCTASLSLTSYSWFRIKVLFWEGNSEQRQNSSCSWKRLSQKR